MTTDLNFYLALLALLLCSIATWRSIFFHSKVEHQKRLLQESDKILAEYKKKICDLEAKGKQFSEFQESLQQAEITTRLQKPRLSTQQVNSSTNPPERYKYIRSLAAGGMSSKEIASVLSISIHEADQLVALARIAHPECPPSS